MPGFIERVMHPERYHGGGKQPPFFEGWYYRLIDATEQFRYAVIPGIFLSRDPQKHHAFIQVLDGMTGGSSYFTFPPDQFTASERDFDVRIGPNRFQSDRIELNLAGQELALRGELRFEGGQPWPVSWTAPGIMGWYGWLTFMECYHGVVSLDHAIHGSLALDGRVLEFSGGRGYIEKDWGQSFPVGYVWMQTNHFERPGICLTASIAVIPFLGRTFPGFIIGFWHDRTLYRFAEYTRAQVEKLAVTDDRVDWVVRDRQHRLEMRAVRARGGLLHGPTRTEMHRRVMETLQGTVDVRLCALENGREREIFAGTGRNAGLEVFGQFERLLK